MLFLALKTPFLAAPIVDPSFQPIDAVRKMCTKLKRHLTQGPLTAARHISLQISCFVHFLHSPLDQERVAADIRT